MWRSNEDEYAEIMRRFVVESESCSSGSSFRTVSGYSIETVVGSEPTAEHNWKVLTRRLRPKVFDSTYCYEVLEAEPGRLVVGRRFLRMKGIDGESYWSVVTY
ncbi:hypothetical protein ASA1KI_03630 [Opitutales bacterium ASA1]|nr:hypothetical protein ASA1KI_03630 [Opitutales bacterium ASA1]